MPRKRNKLLVITPSLNEIGGIQNYTRQFVKASELSGHFESVRVVSVPGSTSLSGLGVLQKIRFLLSAVVIAIFARPDVVVASHSNLGPMARWLSVLSFSDYMILTYGIEVWGDISNSTKSALRSAKRVLTMSHFTKSQLVDTQGIDPERIRVLPGTYPRSVATMPSDDREPVILTVARLVSNERHKGHDTIIRSMPFVVEKVPEAQYVIVGDGDDRLRLSDLAEECGVSDSVVFEGAIDNAAVQNWYSKCSVFAMPAKTSLDPGNPAGEGFGIVYVEAMAAGTPVIGPNIGAPAEIVEDGVEGLLVTPEDVHETANAIIRILDGSLDRKIMGESAKLKAEKFYSPQVYNSTSKLIWDELLN